MMDASFRVLWFEDNPAYVGQIKESVQARLDNYGICFDVTMISDFRKEVIDSITKDIKKSCPYDLIMVDYDLGTRDLQGDVLLKKMRRATAISMIFYSAKTVKQLRELLLAQSVDGVFCLSRDTRLAGNIYAIVESALNRVVQPNYMRGLVVSSVSHMDRLFSEIIMFALNDLALKPQSEVLKSLKRNFILNQKEDRVQMKNVTERTLNRYISKSNFYVKTQLLKELLEIEGSQYSENFLDLVENFIEQVGNKRNKFAHTPTEYVNGVPRIKIDNKILDHNDMKQLLCIIRQHLVAAEQAKQFYQPVAQ
ncbi:hypothetical protein MYA83_25810 [Pseudomonas palleroniana]|uniref:HEPN domain-containing protein n=1 Tax=Pseudomonas palleroniana TaxID=191390 RepID=UPI003AFFF966